MKPLSKNWAVLGRSLAISVIAIVLVVSSVSAATTSRLAVLAIREDRFYNYDFLTQNAASNNVDWPVTMLFYNNAWVDKVKIGIFFGLCSLCNLMNAYLNDGPGWVWDVDRGTKDVRWSSYLNQYIWLHMRVYAPNPPDYMYNIDWGKYVLGTTHYDQYPFETWSGYSEYAENDFASIARSKGYTVFEDWASFYNYEPYRVEGSHIWDNNGYATAVYVP